MPHWTTTARKTEEKMVGDRNRPLGLVLEWKKRKMMMKKNKNNKKKMTMINA
jgi:hypothetical protein